MNGANEDPIFTFLKGGCGIPNGHIATPVIVNDVLVPIWSPVDPSDITWNFEKFLIGRDGILYKRYNPMTVKIFILFFIQIFYFIFYFI